MIKYKYTDLAKEYVTAYIKFMLSSGYKGSREDAYVLFKESLESVLRIYKVERYSEMIGKCSRYLKRMVRVSFKGVSLEEKIKLIELSLAYFVANTYIGGIEELKFLKVSVMKDDTMPGVSFVVGSDLPVDKVHETLGNIFPYGYEWNVVSGADKWVMITSINSAKANYKGMSGIVYTESSDMEAKLTLKRYIGGFAA